ncbi:hypothetical protein GXW83_06580 [Streptacidiphilus sp. PB12-B1b]|uniref:hypothetical protein n=1 Tax=Streptacidiphilus sp. PB12-B1b TaxID=2705012 RepID=UPI0015FB0486|nr:hypothetical protein [Streptacidiphilus sp. PB12-B1b]QMU75461.1 hypothetical protein GXW83_06580 [Streptacidiphilus sp. PB12-B1b]
MAQPAVPAAEAEPGAEAYRAAGAQPPAAEAGQAADRPGSRRRALLVTLPLLLGLAVAAVVLIWYLGPSAGAAGGCGGG